MICTYTLKSQIEGYTRLLIFRKFSILPAVIWASPFINIQENFQPFCFLPTQIKIFPSSPLLLLEPTRLLNLDKNSSLPFYKSLPLYYRTKSIRMLLHKKIYPIMLG